MRTYSPRLTEIKKQWFVVDAKGVVLGRLAAEISKILRGKHKPTYTPHLDTGDYVVVINAAKVHLTGSKRETKKFHWHTGYPGGVRSRTMEQILSSRYSGRVIVKAVERMVTRSALGRKQMRKLRVYPGFNHPHVAQQPEIIDIGSFNPKNRRNA